MHQMNWFQNGKTVFIFGINSEFYYIIIYRNRPLGNWNRPLNLVNHKIAPLTHKIAPWGAISSTVNITGLNSWKLCCIV